MSISQNLVTVISILAPTIVAIVTPLVTLRINTINKEYEIGLAMSSHGDDASIINDLQDYQSALEKQSYDLDGCRLLLSGNIQDSFTRLATELATISRLQYEILKELREPKVSFLKSLCPRNKDLQKSQEQSKKRKEYLDHS